MKIPRHYYENVFLKFEDYLLNKKYKIMHYKKKEILFQDLDVSQTNIYYYILDGYTKICGYTGDGEKKILCFYGKGTFTNLCFDNDVYSVYLSEYLEAITNVTILMFPKETIIEILKNDFDFTMSMFAFNNDLISLLSYHSITIPYLACDTRLCDFLYMSYVYHPSAQNNFPENIFVSQEDIANYIGVTRTQISRSIHKLRELGIISTGHKMITIRDTDMLLSHCSPVINCQ